MDTPDRPGEAQRLDAFVDAAFAFAVTLLIISGGQNLGSFEDLRLALMRIPAFLAGFALIVLFWAAHRAWAGLGAPRDGADTGLSLAVVFVVLVFVFPLRLLFEAAAHVVSGGLLPGGGLIDDLEQLGLAYAVYGVGFAVLSSLFALMFRRAGRRLSNVAAADRAAVARSWARTWTVAAGAGLASAALALTPALGFAPWSPGMVYWAIPISVAVSAWRARRAAPRSDERSRAAS